MFSLWTWGVNPDLSFGLSDPLLPASPFPWQRECGTWSDDCSVSSRVLLSWFRFCRQSETAPVSPPGFLGPLGRAVAARAPRGVCVCVCVVVVGGGWQGATAGVARPGGFLRPFRSWSRCHGTMSRVPLCLMLVAVVGLHLVAAFIRASRIRKSPRSDMWWR